ncbi:hypothetical protein [Chitinophaga silvisoli]|uniref:Uncharacterized protein n=1 Tax=Chitinophaga silvisoli TaxID=2291814 RepID=A0A3E1NXE2_9BACT|nr:hypothetical protein [Chitinophaga silvisoli]RFM32593.1 hypothetical protein DXN04_23230 [Chitinophaga silvisoli]
MAVEIDKDGNGVFYIDEKGKRIAEILVRINNKTLIVFDGNGQWRKLLHQLLAYAKKNDLKVLQHCLYINH